MSADQQRWDLEQELDAARTAGHRIRQRPTRRTPEGAAENRARRTARGRALTVLAAQHPDEYTALFNAHLEQARVESIIRELRRLAEQPL